jgi:hypothetical protein
MLCQCYVYLVHHIRLQLKSVAVKLNESICRALQLISMAVNPLKQNAVLMSNNPAFYSQSAFIFYVIIRINSDYFTKNQPSVVYDVVTFTLR